MLINRILIVGLGSIGKRHLRLARELHPWAEIGVLRHNVNYIIPEGADYIFSTMIEALAFTPQLAVIATPAAFHLSTAMPLAEAGVHLLIEKPLSTTVEGVKDLIEAVSYTHLTLPTIYSV